MLAYTKVTAPYDGVVTVRNANTGDYVQAVTGDKSTPNPSAIFVVARIDVVRVFVDVPEAYARYVQKGTKAVVRAEALSGLQIPATVTRTSWAIREKTRTLRAEIDLSMKDYDGLRPGMYVNTKVLVQRSNVYALPQQTLMVSGNQTYCYLLCRTKAVKTPVQAGISDGTWVEVDQMKIDDPWRKVTGDEDVILADLSELTDGQTVRLAPDNNSISSLFGPHRGFEKADRLPTPQRPWNRWLETPAGWQGTATPLAIARFHERCRAAIVAPADSSGDKLAADLLAVGGTGADGGIGAVGATHSVQLPWQSQCGQTHSTVHLRTGTSLTHGIFTRCLTSWTRHLQPPSPQSWQPSLAPPLHDSPQPAPWPEPSLPPHLSQTRVTPGTQMDSHLHVYLYVVTFLVVQVDVAYGNKFAAAMRTAVAARLAAGIAAARSVVRHRCRGGLP